MSESILLIRPDASVSMGTGHVMRCLALAQAWQDSGGRCIFAMADSTPAIAARLKEEGIQVEMLKAAAGAAEDAAQTAQIAGRSNVGSIVVDGYQFNSAYQSAIKAAGFKLLFLDDNAHAAPYSADLVLNQNLHATQELYAQREPSTQLLLGPRYAMLRREFRSRRNWRREIHAVGRKILITMGGSDPDNLSAMAIEAIQKLSDSNLETTVLAGGSNPHLPALKKLVGEQKSAMRLIIDATNVAEWMTWADVAVSGAGTTFWEMCFLGLPSLLLVLAPNQQGVAVAAHEMKIAWSLGRPSDTIASTIVENLEALLNSRDERMMQSENGRSLVDGRGAERVVSFLSDLQLRTTIDSDCKLFWEWANDPDARAASFRNKTISWDHHVQWFRAKMQDPNAVLFTATNRSGVPIGQVRFQIDGERALLSISLGARFRGHGWGQKILDVATGRIFQESAIKFIDAYVKPANHPSMKLFIGASFLRIEPAVVEGQEAAHFILQRSPSA